MTDQSQPTPHPTRWGLDVALAGLAGGFLLSSVAAFIAEAITGYHANSSAPIPIGVTAADVIGLWVGLVGSAVWASRHRGTGSLARDFGFRLGAWWDLPLGAAVGLLSQYVVIPVLYLPFEHVDHAVSHQLGQPAQRDTGTAHTWFALVALLVILAVGAPLVEELFFRGLLLRTFLARLPAGPAIVLTALLFSLAHFEAVQFAGLAVFGVFLGLLAKVTGRLAPSIAAHMAFNAAAVITIVHLN